MSKRGAPVVGITMFSAQEAHKFYTKVQYNYVSSVVDAGGVPWLIPTVADTALAVEVVARLDALILTGGEDVSPLMFREEPRPELGLTNLPRDRWEIALLAAAEARGIPILGICRGIQVINVHRGGTLYQDITAETSSPIGHAPFQNPMESLHHTITVEPGSRMEELFPPDADGRIVVNSFHHQALRDMGEGLVITSRAPDGIVEAVEDPGRDFFIAVQFHAEALPPIDRGYLRLFEAVVAAAGEAPATR